MASNSNTLFTFKPPTSMGLQRWGFFWKDSITANSVIKKARHLGELYGEGSSPATEQLEGHLLKALDVVFNAHLEFAASTLLDVIKKTPQLQASLAKFSFGSDLESLKTWIFKKLEENTIFGIEKLLMNISKLLEANKVSCKPDLPINLYKTYDFTNINPKNAVQYLPSDRPGTFAWAFVFPRLPSEKLVGPIAWKAPNALADTVSCNQPKICDVFLQTITIKQSLNVFVCGCITLLACSAFFVSLVAGCIAVAGVVMLAAVEGYFRQPWLRMKPVQDHISKIAEEIMQYDSVKVALI